MDLTQQRVVLQDLEVKEARDLAGKGQKCRWKVDGTTWAFMSECQTRGSQIDPRHIRFCPYCAKPVEFDTESLPPGTPEYCTSFVKGEAEDNE